MRTAALAFAALLAGASAHAFEVHPNRLVVPVSVACKTLEQLRSIIRAAQRGGQEASDKVYRRINAAAAPKHRACIVVFSPDPKLNDMRLVEGYAAIETIPGVLRDILVMKMTDLEGKTRYIAIEREFARGYAI